MIIVCFQRRHKGTFEALGSSKKDQYQSIPDSTGQNNKGSNRRPNHDEVQAVTAVKRLHRERVAVNPLQTFVLGAS